MRDRVFAQCTAPERIEINEGPPDDKLGVEVFRFRKQFQHVVRLVAFIGGDVDAECRYLEPFGDP